MLTRKQIMIFKIVAVLFGIAELASLIIAVIYGQANSQEVGVSLFYVTLFASMFWMLFSLNSQEDMAKKIAKADNNPGSVKKSLANK